MNNTFKEKDITLHCIDCDLDFIFTAGEQLYFNSKDLMYPKRCPVCRKNRKMTLVTKSKVREVENG
jgi:hypothetical protein